MAIASPAAMAAEMPTLTTLATTCPDSTGRAKDRKAIEIGQ
jgi:hypothetical protein